MSAAALLSDIPTTPTKENGYQINDAFINTRYFNQKSVKPAPIKDVIAREVLDSRGNWTVEVEVELESGAKASAIVPSGASTGKHEACELRDKDGGVQQAVDNVNTEIKEALVGLDASKQTEIDRVMIELDGTENKSRLGANAILGASLAVAKAVAEEQFGGDLYRYLDHEATDLPTPMINVINGGAHAKGIKFQEFMILPTGQKTYKEALKASQKVFQQLKKNLTTQGHITTVGDEGGFAPLFENKRPEEALDCLMQAIEDAGFEPGKNFYLGLDVASTEFFKDGNYYPFEATSKTEEEVPYTSKQMVNYLKELCEKYPIITIEDGCAEDDWDGWNLLTQELGDKIQLVGDDLFVTNEKRLREGIDKKAANSILIKFNQIGTLTETLTAIEVGKAAGYTPVISHRSGDSEDTTIAHIAVGTRAKQIKTGSLSRSDRVAKYNELVRINDKIEKNGKTPQYHGKAALNPQAFDLAA